ncbi:MAG: cytochrome c oxidase assembly protein subunit [Geobacteraceae bacterium]|nr:MAG: cytochrome c oxidase assembly protein subunit [Geobacteraceae bacterium]
MLGRITVALFFILLVWGNLVAGLKAGLACPDWPLCQGRVLPPFHFDVWMEFMHRVIAAVATLFLIPLSCRRFREYRGAAKSVPLAALVIVAAEILIGGFTVLLELPVQLTTLHFMAGLMVFVLASYMATFDGEEARFSLRGYAGLFFGLGAFLFSQAALGAYVRHSGAGLACADFPTCQGNWLPAVITGPLFVHFSHRLTAYLIFLTFAVLYIAARLDNRLRNHRRTALLLLLACLAQIGVGAGVVLSGLDYGATAAHLALALIMMLLTGRMWVQTIKEGGGGS